MQRREKNTRTRACDVCAEECARLYRVRTEEGGPWRFVCDGCWEGVKRDAEAYAYGGTWTSRKR